ncbi:MAG: hypothetical protein LDL11_08210 [Desulfarculus sp.]|nr:hypothetical protein [Desulfarculus sp.]
MREQPRGVLSAWLPALIILAAATSALAAPVNFGAWLSPELGKLQTSLSYDVNWSPDQNVSGQSAQLGYAQQSLGIFAPVYQNARQEFALLANADYLPLDSDIRFPSGRAFPSDLYDLSLGGLYRHKLDNGLVVGGFLRVGSPSDKPFQDQDEISVNASAFLRLPSSGRNAWLLLLNYDNHRDFLGGTPIPGAAYWWEPSDQFQALVGLPLFSARYQPWKTTTLNFTYSYPHNIFARATQRLVKPLAVFAGFEWSNQRWFLAGRGHYEDMLYLNQKKWLAGTSYTLTPGVDLELTGGWAFDRLFFVGENWGDRDQERVDLDNGAFLKAQLSYRF